MSIISLQFQSPRSWAAEFCQRSRARYVMGIDNYPIIPGVRTLGRPNWPQSDVDRLVASGAQGGREYANWLKGIAAEHPEVYAWLGPNEASIWIPEVLAGWEAFYQELLARTEGLRIVAGNINTGWFQRDQAKAIARGARGAWAFAGHEYGKRGVRWGANVGWEILRHRRLMDWARAEGYPFGRYLITEFGVDNPIANGHLGWREFLTVEEYAAQLAWAEMELGKSGVEACMVFLAGAVDPAWYSFDLDYNQAMTVADALALVGPPGRIYRPPTHPARGTYLSRYQGYASELNWDLIREEFDYLGLRVSAGLDADPTFPGHWDACQAIEMPVFFWHYLTAHDAGQAAHFYATAGGRRPELGWWGDFEAAGLTLEKCDSFLTRMDELTGGVTGCYTGAWWLNPKGIPGWLYHPSGVTRLGWFADPNNTDYPRIPKAWYGTEQGYTFWQGRCGPHSAAIPADICLDEYHGTVEDLRRDFGLDPGNGGNGGPVSVIIEPPAIGDMLTLDTDGTRYKLAKITWREGEPPAAFIEVLDLQGNRKVGTKVTWEWSSGSATGTVEEKPGDPGGVNFLLTAPMPSFGVWVGDVRSESDRAWGLGLGNLEHPDANIHCTWVVTFQEVEEGGQTSHSLTIVIEGQGTVWLDPTLPEYPHGTVITLDADPAEGWTFAGWTFGDGEPPEMANPIQVLMDADKTIMVSFESDNGGIPPEAKARLYEILAEIEALAEEGEALVNGLP